MAIELDTLEQRVVGVLIEKQLTVPDGYPLTLNALVAGCNQKSNRDPFLSVEDYDVEGALRSLMDKGWVTRHEPVTGRVMRYAHEARQQLGIDPEDLAILSELLCRGPQAPGSLKTRASRMRHFDSPAAVEDRLRDMADRPAPYVELLPKQPRERQARWRHLLGKPTTTAGTTATAGIADGIPEAGPSPTLTPTLTPAPAPAAAAGVATDRVAALEAEVADLRARIERLEEECG